MSIETPSITAAWAAKTSCTTGRASSHEAQLMYMKSRTVIFPRKSARCTVFPSMSVSVKSGAAFVAGGWNRTTNAATVITTATTPANSAIVQGRSAPPADLTRVHTHGRYLLDSTREDSKGAPESLLFARPLDAIDGSEGATGLLTPHRRHRRRPPSRKSGRAVDYKRYVESVGPRASGGRHGRSGYRQPRWNAERHRVLVRPAPLHVHPVHDVGPRQRRPLQQHADSCRRPALHRRPLQRERD